MLNLAILNLILKRTVLLKKSLLLKANHLENHLALTKLINPQISSIKNVKIIVLKFQLILVEAITRFFLHLNYFIIFSSFMEDNYHAMFEMILFGVW